MIGPLLRPQAEQSLQCQILEHDDELGQEDEEIDALDLDDEVKQGTSAAENVNQQNRSDGLDATQADLALLEAAMSSAVHHPNVVQTYHYRTLQPDIGVSIGSGRITRVNQVHSCFLLPSWLRGLVP